MEAGMSYEGMTETYFVQSAKILTDSTNRQADLRVNSDRQSSP